MEVKVIVALTLASLLLTGCGQSYGKSNGKKTTLEFSNLKNKEASTNRKGYFVLKGETTPGSRIETDQGQSTIAKGKMFKLRLSLPTHKKWDSFQVSAIHKGFKTNYDFIELDNHSTEYLNGLKAKKKAAAKASVKEAAESSKEGRNKEAAPASSEVASSSQKSVNENSHTHGLSGLKYQADKYLKKDNSVAFYHPVKVLGYDDTKPYVANIEFKANNESKATMKDGAVSILEGVKKADYKDFSNIKISFTQNVSNANGKTLKNIPVLGYSFSRSTLESIDPNNMDSSDLSKVADSHFDKHVENN